MNRIIRLLILLLGSFSAQAQIFNAGFEQVDTSGKIGYWGKEYMRSIWIDSSGQQHQDSIILDRDFYFSTSEAHSGSRAVEMRNAHNYTTNHGIAGAVDLTQLAYTYSTFQNRVSIQQRPGTFSFYYKFLPAGADTAWALMTVYDSTGDEVGTAAAFISQASAGYKQFSIPVVYTSADPAAYLSISFSTCPPYGNPSYGTRFLVDDVNVQSLGLPAPEASMLQCYPSVAVEQITVILPDFYSAHGASWRIIAADGKMLASGKWSANTGKTAGINIAALPTGNYVLSLTAPDRADMNARFIKL